MENSSEEKWLLRDKNIKIYQVDFTTSQITLQGNSTCQQEKVLQKLSATAFKN